MNDTEYISKDAFVKQQREQYCVNCERRKGTKNGKRKFVYEIKEEAKMKRNKSLINICVIGIGIALYVALAATVKIPLIAHIQTDLGYIVFGAYCVWLGVPAILIGVAGCTIESLVFNGMFPPGWFVGQLFIGIVCSVSLYVLKKCKPQFKYTIGALITIAAVFIGIALIKTGIECCMFGISFEVKIVKNIVAFVADAMPMLIGVFIGFKYDSQVTKYIITRK